MLELGEGEGGTVDSSAEGGVVGVPGRAVGTVRGGAGDEDVGSVLFGVVVGIARIERRRRNEGGIGGGVPFALAHSSLLLVGGGDGERVLLGLFLALRGIGGRKIGEFRGILAEGVVAGAGGVGGD